MRGFVLCLTPCDTDSDEIREAVVDGCWVMVDLTILWATFRDAIFAMSRVNAVCNVLVVVHSVSEQG